VKIEVSNRGFSTMSLEQTEQECATVATAPRVPLADIEAAIAARYDFTAEDAIEGLSGRAPMVPALSLLSICILVLNNGFSVVGKSAPASPENFNAELGKKLAYEDAIRQLWPLMGFALRDRLHAGLPLADSTLP
jgi:hypothetical protein